MPSRANAGVNRDRAVRGDRRDALIYQDRPLQIVATGSSASAGQTSLELFVNGESVAPGELGVPVPRDMMLSRVAASWVSDTDPGDVAVLTFSVRLPGESSFVDVATFDVETSA